MMKAAIAKGLMAAVMVTVGLGVGAAFAQEKFPSKPITLIVPWPTGGGSDLSMRLVADAAGKVLGQPIVVVNKPGAGGAIGTREIASAAPDGYTIGMVGNGVVARMYANPNANDIKDLQPLVFFGPDPAAITVRADLGVGTLKEFIAKAKAKPKGLKNGSDQPGGSSYVGIAIYEDKLGVKTTRVPYQGYALQVQALLSGEVDSVTVPLVEVVQYHKTGKVKILGVSDSQRHFLAPDVPTFKEQGFDVIYGSWRMIVAPKGIPEDRLKILESALVKAMSDPEFIARARKAGFDADSEGRCQLLEVDDRL